MTRPVPPILVDETHCGRHVTGLERITLELFSAEALAPLRLAPVRAPGRKAMMLGQTLGLPVRALVERAALVLCPGFPPSIPLMLLAGDRVIPYIHDLFLLTRPDDLNRRAKLYMVAPFRFTVRRAALFLVNSEATAAELRRFCRPEARIVPYRPAVRNVFGAEPGDRATRAGTPGGLRLVAVGTV
ncbi:glycosyltransferase, partial [Lichenihabitans sp. Uapishka_5]|uniref:glycosyltransferase n=1 Tax=Lichenihabitans sp. Uapishka_5 TaxID=3037302 RepID=UPI0029E8031F